MLKNVKFFYINAKLHRATPKICQSRNLPSKPRTFLFYLISGLPFWNKNHLTQRTISNRVENTKELDLLLCCKAIESWIYSFSWKYSRFLLKEWSVEYVNLLTNWSLQTTDNAEHMQMTFASRSSRCRWCYWCLLFWKRSRKGQNRKFWELWRRVIELFL